MVNTPETYSLQHQNILFVFVQNDEEICNYLIL